MYNAEVENYMNSINSSQDYRKRLRTFIPLLSIFVILIVFWCLKLTGITMAGDAFCGHQEHEHNESCTVKTLICEEITDTEDTAVDDETESSDVRSDGQEASYTGHQHSDECYETTYTCGLEEHIHISGCYSDISADIETADNWEKTMEGIPAELPAVDKLIAIAESQIGYIESELNFVVDDNGEKHGYTRYGEWYGNKYGKWSAMFTSFCLKYAGLDNLPASAGAEDMKLDWQDKGLYKEAENYIPCKGDIVFLDKDNDSEVDATAITVGISGASVEVIEGDLNNKVAENSYELTDKIVKGYGVIPVTKGIVKKQKTFVGARAAAQTIATKADYNVGQLHLNNQFVLYTQGSDGNYYAIDGNSNAVRIYIDSAGNITTDSADIESLYWVFEYCGTYDNQRTYYIQNVKTGKYMHPYRDSNTSHGALLTGRWESALYVNGTGVRIRGARQTAYAYLQNNSSFTDTSNYNSSSIMYFGKAPTTYSVWLDGTNGGLMSLAGSPDTKYSVAAGGKMTLPAEWQSPSKYSYKLKGWYDVVNGKFYPPGAEITVNDNMLFYAEWIAATYDVGQYNSHVADTVSTESFITTRVFDYNTMFNILSQTSSASVSASGHTESWALAQTGNVSYQNKETLGFIFADYDANGDISYPNNRNSANISNSDVHPDLYNDTLGDILFGTDNLFDYSTGEGIPGKQYLGTADHLFSLDDDPSSEHYGYYYYDSRLNAASYNQTDGRFYVYDYLERTADSEKDGGAGEYSDFLPFNSPYANTNGKNVGTYTYDGENGEYAGVNHCQYDAKYNTNNNSVNNVGTNYWFGMSLDLRFYLPEAPGSADADGNYGNKDIYGKDMHFKFSGDDDVWVLLDGKLVLDIGGIHGVESGDINFSTGVITVNGTQVGTLDGVESGEHVLTVYYLERGSSQSNCAIYFNLAPRYELSIQKEDVLTQELLNGVEFSVYKDKECTEPAELWASKTDYDNNKPPENTFRIENGIANIWGFGAGNTYYIKETRAPDADGYSLANGIIRLSFDKTGTASHSIEVIKETDENGEEIPVTSGYTVHGFRIDDVNQKAYVVITNAQDWVEETTTVQVMKEWNDTEDHTYHSVTAYLTITDPDGTVRRIREIALSEENDWSYTWTNLPKYYQDGTTEIQYGVEEAYHAGYSPSVEQLEQIIVDEVWDEALSFKNGEEYILGSAYGYLSTVSGTDGSLKWVDEDTAKDSSLALWTATVNSNNVRLTNGNGQILTFNYSYGGSYYKAQTSNGRNSLVAENANNGLKLYYSYGSKQYIGTNLSNGRLMEAGGSSNACVFVPKILVTEEKIQDIEDFAYEITNTPLDEETSLKVTKEWDIGMATDADYERAQVTIKLIANGKDTGRTVTLSLKNNWTDIFRGLPYKDADGSVIEYTVEESWENKDWLPVYGEVIIVGGEIPTYETTVTNSYRWGHGYELPATGGSGIKFLLISGFVTMMAALICLFILRRRRERGYG